MEKNYGGTLEKFWKQHGIFEILFRALIRFRSSEYKLDLWQPWIWQVFVSPFYLEYWLHSYAQNLSLSFITLRPFPSQLWVHDGRSWKVNVWRFQNWVFLLSTRVNHIMDNVSPVFNTIVNKYDEDPDWRIWRSTPSEYSNKDFRHWWPEYIYRRYINLG